MSFNTKGEMNAVSTRDALTAITKMAKILEEGQASNMSLAGRPSLTDHQRDELVKNAIMTSEGKVALGQAMALPIRRNLDYKGVGRRALVVDPLTVAA